MSAFYLCYNPYKVETRIQLNGNDVKASSSLNIPNDKRLQEWIENLPDLFRKECNSKNFEITFEGTDFDFDDVFEIVEEANANGYNIKLSHSKSKTVVSLSSKEQDLAEIFADIQSEDAPLPELKRPNIIHAFNNALKNECPVDVVATMSAGKSTLINALLSQKLMPSQQEACTATITEVHDSDLNSFRATAFDSQGDVIFSIPELTLENMTELNRNADVSRIEAIGDIPFVDSDEISLVLIDTPGPNNSRNLNHKAETYRMIDETSKSLVLYVLNATQLGVNDDSNLLTKVAESMKVGGKQSRDRFIFVVNKLDEYKAKEDSVSSALEKVRVYLENKGIESPTIYPISALTALNLRTVIGDKNIYERDLFELMNEDPELASAIHDVISITSDKNSNIHLEKYAPITNKQRKSLNERIAIAVEKNNSEDKAIKSDGTKELALVHSGIPCLEEAIKTYVLKYARTAKIKTVVSTFKHNLEDSKIFLNLQNSIATNEKECAAIQKEIDLIEEKLKDEEMINDFKRKINSLDYSKDIANKANDILTRAQKKINDYINDAPKKMSKSDAEQKRNDIKKFFDDLQIRLQLELENVISEHVKKNADALLKEYAEKISKITDGCSVSGIKLNDFISAEFCSMANVNITSAIEKERVKVGENKYKNPQRKWYKPWTWGKDKFITEDITEEREFIDGGKLATKMFSPVQASLFNNVDEAKKYATDQVNFIRAEFKAKFDELDSILESKVSELKKIISDQESRQAALEESEKKLAWLKQIEDRLDKALEI